DARFHVYGGDLDLWLANDGLWITLLEAPTQQEVPDAFDPEAHLRLPSEEVDQSRQGVNLKLSFVDANPQPEIEPFNLLETKMNYFLGNDSEKWRSNVPVYGGVRYKDIYPGIDLELTSQNGQTVQRLVVHSHAHLDKVQLRVEGTEEMELDTSRTSGEVIGLTVKSAIGDVTLPLFALVTPDGTPLHSARVPTLNANEIRAPFAASQETLALVPDSTLIVSSFIGGTAHDCLSISATIRCPVALDSAGNIFMTSTTESSDFPTTAGSYDTTFDGATNMFVSKLSSAGDVLLYSTFIGGSYLERGYGLTLDSAGNIVVTGDTDSKDFPTTKGSYDTTYNSISSRSTDAFVFKLNPAGDALIYSTFIGGSSSDAGSSLALDSADNVVVTGSTYSPDFPTTKGSYDTTHYGNGVSDVFVFKLNSAGDALIYSTFIGDLDSDYGSSVALDSAGNAVIAGSTNSREFPTTEGSYDTMINKDNEDSSEMKFDIFVLQLSSTGDALIYSTFIGEKENEQGYSLVLDSAGNPVVTGITDSSDFPTTVGSYDRTYNGGQDGFVVKLNSTGNALIYSTLIGGTNNDYPSSVALNSADNPVVTGSTGSSDFPTTKDAYDTSYDNGDAFVLQLSSSGNALTYSTFIGGTANDIGYSLALDSAGNAVVTGITTSSDFPTTEGSYDTSYNGQFDMFVLKLALEIHKVTYTNLYLPLIVR
ncbi:MAG: SBBP repeat-containing protein, partial [Ardenticatenaceae bacterium]